MKKTIISVLLTVGVLLPAAAFAGSGTLVIASSDANSSIAPSGHTYVGNGDTDTFSISAAQGYQVSSVSVNGSSVGDVSTVDVTGGSTFSKEYIDVSSAPMGGGGQPYCSGPMAPGWNVSLPGGGCGSSETYMPAGSVQCPVMDRQGCMVPNK